MNGVAHASSSDQVNPPSLLKPEQSQESPEKKEPRATKEVAFDVADSRRSSNSNYAPNESDSEEEEEDLATSMDMLDDTSRIPKYGINYFIASPWI